MLLLLLLFLVGENQRNSMLCPEILTLNKFILKSRKSPASWELFCSRIFVTSSTGVDCSTHPRGSVEFVGLVE